MKIDNKEKQNISKSKYMLVGFIVGIIPFMAIILISSNISGNVDTVPKVFKDTIIIFGIITSFINAFVFKSMMLNKKNKFSK